MVFSCWVVGAFGQVLHENVSQIGHSYGLFGMAPTELLYPKTLGGASSGWSYSCPKCVFGYQLQK